MDTSAAYSYSADVQLNLLVENRVISLGQVGPQFAILTHPDDVPAGTNAVLEVIIDGYKNTWEICLVNGIVPFDRTFEFTFIQFHKPTRVHPKVREFYANAPN